MLSGSDVVKALQKEGVVVEGASGPFTQLSAVTRDEYLVPTAKASEANE